MEPGHRRDTLGDLIGGSNWKKLTDLGEAILCKVIEAVSEWNGHRDDLRELGRSLEERCGDQPSKWKPDVEAWGVDMSKPNPFEMKGNTKSRSTSDHAGFRAPAACKSGSSLDTVPVHIKISPSALISAGIDSEEQQQRLRFGAEKLGSHATDQRKARLFQRSNALIRRIEAWTDVRVAVHSLRRPPPCEDISWFRSGPIPRTLPSLASMHSLTPNSM
ncbi:hypothetical protein J3R83DRAFT_13481 [Lanmaoa asiatica]|nr:hypothetical protein J3R83DRAFT_13481 [Lanmaoa asiatica]